MRRGQIVISILIFRFPFLQQLQPSHSVVQTAPIKRQRPNDILLVLLAAARIEKLPRFETGLDVGGALVVLGQEFVVVFDKVGSSRND